MKKCSFSFTPTPLHPLEKISGELGVDVWIKRDDLTGCIATGGNKIRKLEYILADALEKGADTVITTGGPQSNHAKTTAALAVKVGLKPVLVLAGKEPKQRRANLFLNQLMGADIRFSGAVTPEQMELAIEETYLELQEKGHKPYLIPIGGSNGLGTLGYIDAYKELGNHDFDWIVVTAGSGGTYAGLVLGIVQSTAQKETRLLGVSPWLKKNDIEERIRKCIQEAEDIILNNNSTKQQNSFTNIDGNSQFIIDDAYIGQGYGKMTQGAKKAIERMAEKEGIFLDHVYTGKAMDALIDYIERGIICKGEKVLFWHTGGAPGLLAIQDEWEEKD